jgi:hypothetical protein
MSPEWPRLKLESGFPTRNIYNSLGLPRRTNADHTRTVTTGKPFTAGRKQQIAGSLSFRERLRPSGKVLLHDSICSMCDWGAVSDTSQCLLVVVTHLTRPVGHCEVTCRNHFPTAGLQPRRQRGSCDVSTYPNTRGWGMERDKLAIPGGQGQTDRIYANHLKMEPTCFFGVCGSERGFDRGFDRGRGVPRER